MKEIIYLKKFSHLLKINKNKIVDYWLDMQEVKDIFLTTQLSNEEKRIFYDFFDCIVNVLKWELSMSDCPIKNDFLKLLNKNSLNIINLFTLLSSLKASLFRFFYKEELLSFALQRDIEKNFLLIKNELYIDYEHLLSQKCNIKDKHSNLLSEYKKAVDLSNIVSKTNPKGLITYANDKFCEISGYKREELIGKAHNLIRHPSMPSSVFKELWDTIKNKKTWQGLITNLRKDGRSYVVHSTIVPILDIDGDIVEFIAIRNDVTEFENYKGTVRHFK
ncbi:PAS domain-containing protein [Aliarcobacter butzleri]|nr:PAS domain-containing protein [Aliarcobacter butzleri]